MTNEERTLRAQRAGFLKTARAILDRPGDDLNHNDEREIAAAMAGADAAARQLRQGGATDVSFTSERSISAIEAELNSGPSDGPLIRSGAEHADAARDGAALRSNQRVQDLPDIPKTGLRIGKFLRGIAVDNWKDAAAEKRAIQNEGTGSAGQYLTNPELSAQVVDLIRANQVMQAAGAQTIRMQDSQTPQLFMAKLLSDPTSQWLGEGAAATPSTATFGRITFTPHNPSPNHDSETATNWTLTGPACPAG